MLQYGSIGSGIMAFNCFYKGECKTIQTLLMSCPVQTSTEIVSTTLA